MTPRGPKPQNPRRRRGDPLEPPRVWINPRAAELLARVFRARDLPAQEEHPNVTPIDRKKEDTP